MSFVKRHAKLVVVFVVLVVVATTGIIFSQKPTTAQDGPKWYDKFSKCKEDCPSLDIANCNCFVFPPIIIEV